jgi:glyoxylase-like metal-dependent hydrolase (beta-lactamase superfamily II)
MHSSILNRRQLMVGLGGLFAISGLRAHAEIYAPGKGVEVVQFTRPGNGSVNSYLLVGSQSVTIIDCQRTSVEAAALARMVEGIGKPVDAIVLTHEHPDHTMGLDTISRAFPAAPILASEITQDYIAKSGRQTAEFMKNIFPGAIPDGIPSATRIITGGERLELAGAEWVVDQRGAAEALGMTLLHAPAEGILVASDLFGNRFTPYLVEGRTAGWLEELAAVRDSYAGVDRALPGHGSAAPLVPLVDGQAAYLNDIRRDDRCGHGSRPSCHGCAVPRVSDGRPRRPDGRQHRRRRPRTLSLTNFRSQNPELSHEHSPCRRRSSPCTVGDPSSSGLVAGCHQCAIRSRAVHGWHARPGRDAGCQYRHRP